MSESVPTPKVFLSYSHTSPGHKDWVVRLAERMASDGVEVVADFWDLRPGHDLNPFMERMATDPAVTKVLAVCDARYAKKANERSGGVGTESQIISEQVYRDVGQEKFIALVREHDEAGKPCLPVFFASRLFIDFSDDELFGEKYDQLLRDLFNRPERKRPARGKPPAHLFTEEQTPVQAASKLVRLREAVERNKPHLDVLAGEFLDSFLEGLEEFRISTFSEDEVPADEQVADSILRFVPYRNCFIDFAGLFASYLDVDAVHDRVHEFLERLLGLRYRPSHLNSWCEWWFDNYRFFGQELFLSLLAVLIGRKKYAAAARYINDVYHVPDPSQGRVRPVGCDVFNNFNRTLDETRKVRLRLNWFSLTAELLRERATHPKVDFPALFQIDVLLFLHPHLATKSRLHWLPRTIGYALNAGTRFTRTPRTKRRGQPSEPLHRSDTLSHCFLPPQRAMSCQMPSSFHRRRCSSPTATPATSTRTGSSAWPSVWQVTASTSWPTSGT